MNTRVASLISDPILLFRATRELGRLALVTIDGQTVSVHRLIQALLREELSPEEQAAYRGEVQLINGGRRAAGTHPTSGSGPSTEGYSRTSPRPPVSWRDPTTPKSVTSRWT